MRVCFATTLLFASLLQAQESVVPIGSPVAATFTDRRWQQRSLAELGAEHATVVFFATIDCPLVQRYLPRIGRLAHDYAQRGVVVLVMNVGQDDAFVDAVGQVTEIAPAAVFGRDFELTLARACGVDRTAAAVVLDSEHRLVYRGRVDDQHGYAGARPEPSRDDLRLALDELLAGEPIRVASTAISGCKITASAKPSGETPTYLQHVEPIVQRHCVVCHRPGGEAPFSLRTERQVKKHAAMIQEVVQQQRMPPWYASSVHGTFVNHRGLSGVERETVHAWVLAGMPRGGPLDASTVDGPDTEEAQPGAARNEVWRIGEPDLVLSLKAPVRLPADGVIEYRYFALPFHFTEDTWVEAIEIRPDNERVLHHCNLARVKFGEQFSQQNFITGYVPGGDAMVLDPGTAVRIPAGSALALQAHYVATGRPEQDRLRVALRFPRVKVQKELMVSIVGNTRFTIPAGARAHPVTGKRRLPVDAIGIGLFVHMHVRGRDMAVSAEGSDGSRETLLLVPNYNFDWQQSYRWPKDQKKFAAGTTLRALAHFDNSAWNPFNPDAEQDVHFGLQTTDEMMYAFVFWFAEHEQLGLDIDPATGHVVASAGR